MIDEEWLKSLRFTFPETGTQIIGFLGQGENMITFEGVGGRNRAEGDANSAMQFYKPHLGWYIKEIPPSLTSDPTYTRESINNKIYSLMGDANINYHVTQYDRISRFFVHQFWKNEPSATIFSARMAPQFCDYFDVLCFGGPVWSRLKVASLLPDVENDYCSFNGTPNGKSTEIYDSSRKIRLWARKALQHIEVAGAPNNDLFKTPLEDNPLYIWGAAVLCDFIESDDDLSFAAKFIEDRFGSLVRSPNVAAYSLQMGAFLFAQTAFQDTAPSQVERTKRLIRFLNTVGFDYPGL